MDRREALKHTSLFIGLAVSGSAVAAVMQGCNTRVAESVGEAWEPVFFNETQMELVGELVETIFPRTQTPGARDVFVHHYIDLALAHHFKSEDQVTFQQGLAEIEARSQADHTASFVTLPAEQKKSLLETVEREAHEQLNSASSDTDNRPFFITLKELTYTGYFSSELIGEEHLNYDPIPGAYNGCVPVDDIGKAWTF